MGEWGLGIGDGAQSPIPNPQSPIPKYYTNTKLKNYKNNFKNKKLQNYNMLYGISKNQIQLHNKFNKI